MDGLADAITSKDLYSVINFKRAPPVASSHANDISFYSSHLPDATPHPVKIIAR